MVAIDVDHRRKHGAHPEPTVADSAGRICAETVTCYPPGIPILVPGERITPAAVQYCLTLQRQGYTILGPEDPTLNTLEVVA